jgi:Asp-tRNA(Asn)/Glu-tRNA(Gln) amidotransferase A subunit family amidase
MARSVADAATILSVIAGHDPLDNFTLTQPQPVPNYRDALNSHALRGVRLGVPRKFQGTDENIIAAFNASIEIIRNLGAVVVDPAEFPDADELFASNNETIVLSTDFKVGNNGQLQKRLVIMTFIIGRFEQVHYQPRDSSYGHKESSRSHYLQHQTCKRGTHTSLLCRPISVILGYAISVYRTSS